MSREMKVRMYAHVEIRVPVDTVIDLDEFEEWASDPSDKSAEKIVEYIDASVDDSTYLQHRLPKPDWDVHEVWSCDWRGAEVLL